MISPKMLEIWVEYKALRQTRTIRSARHVQYEHKRHLGPRWEYAHVDISATPNSEFSFESRASWPAFLGDCDHVVFEGILDELLATCLGRAVCDMHLVLNQVRCHEVDSSANAFYLAARGAISQIF